jgi:hypothetical protein
MILGAVSTPETSVSLYETTQRNISEGVHLLIAALRTLNLDISDICGF